MSEQQQRQQPTVRRDTTVPPAYDTLSLAPPAIEEGTSRSSSNVTNPSTLTTPNNRGPSTGPLSTEQQQQQQKKSMKQRWRDLKDEDARRKSERLVHVSPEEADRITGLDKHRQEEQMKSADGRRRGGKSVLGIIALS